MPKKLIKNFVALLVLGLLYPTQGQSQGFSQIVAPFNEERRFDYSFNPETNTLTLEVKDTRPDELAPLFNYDGDLIRRVVFKELSNQNTQVHFVLKDSNIQAAVYSFHEPFRIVIDLFDRRFVNLGTLKRGLPLAETYDNEPQPRSLRTTTQP